MISKNSALVQLYTDGTLRAFSGNNMIFEVGNVNYRVLDFLGLPRLPKKVTRSTWQRRGWGWELEGEFSFHVFFAQDKKKGK